MGIHEAATLRPLDTLQARWEADGKIIPQRFQLDGVTYTVTSVGRAWRDEAGYHVLCMAGSDEVFEFLLTPGLVWQVRLPAQPKHT